VLNHVLKLCNHTFFKGSVFYVVSRFEGLDEEESEINAKYWLEYSDQVEMQQDWQS
jgi:hypothetical protein